MMRGLPNTTYRVAIYCLISFGWYNGIVSLLRLSLKREVNNYENKEVDYRIPSNGIVSC